MRGAIKADDDWAVFVIADHCPEAINDIDDLGFTAMHIVASSTNKRIAESLIQRGGDLKKKHRFGKTPVEIAAQKGSSIFVAGA